VSGAFPQHPPYGGAYDDVLPHLTIAEQRLADLHTLLEVERAMQSALPLAARLLEGPTFHRYPSPAAPSSPSL
jgi:hypothetical protein